MTKKYWSMFSIMLIAVLALAACGGNATPTEKPAVEEPAAAEPTDEPVVEEPAEPVASILIWADDTRSQILLPLAEEFEATYGVEVIVQEVAFNRDQFIVAAPAGEGPDIFIGPHDWIGEFVASGLLEPIDLGDKSDLFTNVSLKGCTYDGQLYCMPYAVENLGFFYNTDLVPEPPTTWEELVEIGTALQEEGAVTYGLVLSGTTYDAYPIHSHFGGYAIGLDENGNINPSDFGIGGEGMIASGNWISEQVESGFLADNTDWDTAHVLFETGESPFIMAGPWALERIRDSGIPYAITTFPGDGVPFAGVQGFFVNAFSENILLAQAFLTEFVAADGPMTQLLDAGMRPSAFISVADATEDADLAALGVAGAEAVLMPAVPEMGSVWTAWADAFSLIINGDETPEDALANAQSQIQDLIAGALAGMVNAPGSWQEEAGCPGDWDPACEVTVLTEGDDGLYSGSFSLPAGEYEVKIALDGSWAVNYGVEGVRDGDNYKFTLGADGVVTFTFDPATNILTIETE